MTSCGRDSRGEGRRVARAAVVVRVRVTPRSGRDQLAGWAEGAIRVRLAAPPVDGRANAALVRFLAQAAELTPSAVRIVAGDTGREKRVAFEGIDAATLAARLGIPPGHLG